MFTYIHIPFCESKCKYCRFASFSGLDDFKIKKYVKSLLYEIKSSNLDYLEQKSIYFGGGTPSTLNHLQLSDIITKFKNITKSTEITLESTPKNITRQNLQSRKKIGINRLSIGVQSLNNETLKEIGRGEKGDVINALQTIKEIGFENISLDFIIGLPYVKKGELKKDIQYLLDNFDFIKHISVYMLEDYYEIDNDKNDKDSRFENITYPKNWSSLGIDEQDFLGEYPEIKEFLQKRGFSRYEISNFAKKGYECKHNMAYWNHSEISGFGLGASYFLGGVRYTNSDQFSNYYKRDHIYSEKLSEQDLFLEKIMFELRTTGITKQNYLQLNSEKIEELIENGLIKKEDNYLKLSDKGIVFLDYILREV